MSMNALSRREEETLMKSAKTRALKECDPIVKGAAMLVYLAIMDSPKLTLFLLYDSRVRRLCNRSDSLCSVGV